LKALFPGQWQQMKRLLNFTRYRVGADRQLPVSDHMLKEGEVVRFIIAFPQGKQGAVKNPAENKT
jgi:hypothetical protein